MPQLSWNFGEDLERRIASHSLQSSGHDDVWDHHAEAVHVAMAAATGRHLHPGAPPVLHKPVTRLDPFGMVPERGRRAAGPEQGDSACLRLYRTKPAAWPSP